MKWRILSASDQKKYPIHHGYFPEQLSMDQTLRTWVPWHPDGLKPKTPKYDHIRRKERNYRAKMKFDYDHKHRPVEEEELSPGDRVWIPDLKVEGMLIK